MRLFLVLFLIFAAPAMAQNTVAADKPVAIEASGQLEWLRDQSKYRATGDVVITQGATTIKGDTAEAQYDPEKGNTALTTISMTGNVVITHEGNTITADSAVYDTRSEALALRGNDVTVKAPQATVTANGGMDYFAKERKAVATGRAEAKQDNKSIKADTITAWFSAKGNKLEKAEARGHVIITQKTDKGTDIAQSQFAQYDLDKEIAKLSGNVKLTQGKNHMQGDTATLDMKTGVATLANQPNSTGRVRAIFTPGGDTPLPDVSGTIPMAPGKQNPEMPYQVGG